MLSLPNLAGASTSNNNVHQLPSPKLAAITSNSNVRQSPSPNLGASTSNSNVHQSLSPSLGASTSNSNVYLLPTRGRSDEELLLLCLPVYRALLRGDECGFEQAARSLWPLLPPYVAMSKKITRAGDTALHVLVGTGKWFDSLENSDLKLTLRDRAGRTPLCVAAMVGNMKAAEKLLQLEMELPPIMRDQINATGPYPIIEATRYGHKEMVLLLIGDYMARKMERSQPTEQSTGPLFLHMLVVAGFYDVLLVLVRRYPGLAGAEFYGDNDESLLSLMAEKPSAFRSGTQLGFLHRLFYSAIPAKLESKLADIGKFLVVNRPSAPQPPHELTILAWLAGMIDSCISHVIGIMRQIIKPYIAAYKMWKEAALIFKHIKDTKLMHEETLDTVKCLCKELMEESSIENIEPVLRKALLLAASSGISEIIEEIIDHYPDSIWFVNSENQNLFHLAVINRHEKVFNLIYQLGSYKHLIVAGEDTSGNNILHMAGKLAPPGRLNLISCAALQMQRELQWFQELEMVVPPTFRTKKNSDGKTPKMVFSEEHKELVKEGEKWMKETATSCIIVAALTATVGFAAAITVPGGNNQNTGFPLFSNEAAFTVFAVSVALCLVSSVISLLLFLSVLTSRYTEDDFLRRLPRILMVGLLMLSVSLTTLTVAFSATIYLLFGMKKGWILITVGMATNMTVSLIIESLEFPFLLVKLMSRTKLFL